MPKPVSPPAELDRRVGVQLRQLRRALGLSQAELAARAHWTHQKIYTLENGQKRVELDEIVLLMRALKVPFSALVPVADIEAEQQAADEAQARTDQAGIEGWRWRIGCAAKELPNE